MSLVGRLLWRVDYHWQFAASIWRLQRLRLIEGQFHHHLEVGPGTRFCVPVRTRGVGSLVIGANNQFGFSSAPRLGTGEILLQAREKDARIAIGKENWLSNNVSIVAHAEVSIGDGCRIADQVAIYDCDFHEVSSATRNRTVGPVLPVTIGNNVWLGSRVMVLKGVTIGENTVVGAASLVTRSLPANCVAAGIPAKFIRSIE